MERRLTVKDHMRWIFAVVPICKKAIIGLKARHDPQPATRPQQRIEPVKLNGWIVEMLGDFSTSYEIVGTLQRTSVRREKRIVDLHAVPCLAQHSGKRRPRTTTIGEAFKTRGQFSH